MKKLLGFLLAALMLTGCGARQGTAVTAPSAGTARPAPAATDPAAAEPVAAEPAATEPTAGSPSYGTSAQPPAGAPAPSPAPPSVLDLTVKMLDYSYEPNLITVPVGAHVKLTILNAGQKSHDLNIIGGPSMEGAILKPGESQVMEFTADKAGQFQIVCSQRGHKEKGMVATLVIK